MVIIMQHLHKTPVFPSPAECLLRNKRNNHRGPSVNKYDQLFDIVVNERVLGLILNYLVVVREHLL